MDDSPVEILVHIAAQSRAADDARYRALASAYIGFEPANRLSLQDPDEPNGEQPVSSTPHTSIFRRDRRTPSPAYDHLEPSQGQGGPSCSIASPQASFRSVIDNAGSPRVVRVHHVPSSQPSVPLSASQTDSWQSPGSLVGDSQPEVSVAVADLTSPTRLLEYYLQGFDSFTSLSWSPSQRPSSVAAGEQLRSDTSPSSSRQEASQNPIALAQTVDVVPSSVPYDESHESSLSFSELRPVAAVNNRIAHVTRTITRETSAHQSRIPEEAAPPDLHVGLVPLSRPISLGRSDSEPLAIPKSSLSTTHALHQALSRAASDLGPRSSNTDLPSSISSSSANLSSVTFFPSHGYTFESLDLCAPEPPVASVAIVPSDLVTPQLRDLLADAQPRRRKSQPQTQTRELRPTERGYWDVDCSSWPPDLKRATWAHLANWIGMGLAGWGTRCTRDDEFVRVRVYCWGETAPYLYYLLWLTSYRKILAAECAWIDADGEAVLVMGTC